MKEVWDCGGNKINILLLKQLTCHFETQVYNTCAKVSALLESSRTLQCSTVSIENLDRKISDKLISIIIRNDRIHPRLYIMSSYSYPQHIVHMSILDSVSPHSRSSICRLRVFNVV